MDDGPPREGVRGGLEQFRWDSLKGQSYKDREQYLGYSTKLGQLGRFGKYTTNSWWRDKNEGSKDGGVGGNAIESEKASAKQMEEELFAEALGLKPKRLLLAKGKLSSEQVNEMLKKDENASGAPGSSNTDAAATVVAAVHGTEDTQGLEEESLHRTGLGFRKYLKPTDWTEGADGVLTLKTEDDVDELKQTGQLPTPVPQQSTVPPRTLPTVKTEEVDGKLEAPSQRKGSEQLTTEHRHHHRKRSHSRKHRDEKKRSRSPSRRHDRRRSRSRSARRHGKSDRDRHRGDRRDNNR